MTYRNPLPTVDVIVEPRPGHVVLIRRQNPPHGWALPGGFVDWGESLPDAARREVAEETGLEVALVRQLGAYGAPDRDPRQHTITVVFHGRPADPDAEPVGADDAAEARVFALDALPELAFDHATILADFAAGRGPSVG